MLVPESLFEAEFKKKILENRCCTIKVDLEVAMNNSSDKSIKVNCDDSENIVEHIRKMAEALETRHRGNIAEQQVKVGFVILR